MDDLALKVFVLGPISTNCYLVTDTKTKQAVIIDAPDELDQVREFVRENDIAVQFILLTHAHFDHIGGLGAIDAPFYVHCDDAVFLSDSQANGSAFFGPEVTVKSKPRIVRGGEKLSFGAHSIEVLHVPGHTPGGVAYKFDGWLFSGDSLFSHSVGRSDFPYGSHDVLVDAIKKKLLVLPDDTVVYPGHGAQTTIGKEKKSNPFLL